MRGGGDLEGAGVVAVAGLAGGGQGRVGVGGRGAAVGAEEAGEGLVLLRAYM